MNVIKKTFDLWASNGRDELMQKEHSKNVNKFLNSISFTTPFSFLDVGCGNGWVVKKIAKMKNCKKAVGIDTSKKMIQNAILKKDSDKEEYHNKNILTWTSAGKFDYIFAMESLYYLNPMEEPLKKILELLKPNGIFFCGTDFYKDNKVTGGWSKLMKMELDYRYRSEWKKMFEKIGFETRTKLVKDTTNKKKWKREFGTLFVIGKKLRK